MQYNKKKLQFLIGHFKGQANLQIHANLSHKKCLQLHRAV